jgi:hypothetical protein
VNQGVQATQLAVNRSHAVPGAQVPDPHASPGLAFATHRVPSQVPVAHTV